MSSVQRRKPRAPKKPRATRARGPALGGRGAYKPKKKRRALRGRGDYTMDSEQSFGHRWGGYLGSKAGEFLGGAAQNLVKSLTGLGDYKVRRNVFLEGHLPEVINIPSGGGNVIRFQEYLGDVITSATPGAFNIQGFLINAGNPQTFPFLSQIAGNYEQYDVEGMVFEFRSTSADALNSTNTALGSVLMATQYDANDVPFTNKLEMLNYEYSTSCKPSVSNLHMIECDPRQTTVNELYTLYGSSTPANSDIRLYHLGRFQIATVGFQGAFVNVGEIHVTYQVRLLKPKMFTNLGNNDLYFRYVLGNATAGVFSNAAPLGITPANAVPSFSNIACVINPTSIVFPVSTAILYFRIEIHWVGLSGSAIVYPTVTVTNGTNQSSFLAPQPSLTGTTQATYALGVASNGSALPLTVSFAGDGILPTGNQQVIVRIMGVPPQSLAQ